MNLILCIYQLHSKGLVHSLIDYNIFFHEIIKFLFLEQKGCCKPPAYCGYELKNGTTWTVPKSGLRSKDHDCVTWSNDPRIMCYDCDSCKAGFLARIKNNWRKLSAFFSCLIAFLVINFVIGCCAFRGSRGVDQYQKHGNSN